MATIDCQHNPTGQHAESVGLWGLIGMTPSALPTFGPIGLPKARSSAFPEPHTLPRGWLKADRAELHHGLKRGGRIPPGRWRSRYRHRDNHRHQYYPCGTDNKGQKTEQAFVGQPGLSQTSLPAGWWSRSARSGPIMKIGLRVIKSSAILPAAKNTAPADLSNAAWITMIWTLWFIWIMSR
jgi:hypothetical protein